MRRCLLLLGLLPTLALVLASCGSSSTGGPLGTELSYFPSSSPFIMSLQTDPQSTAVKNGQSFVGRFPNVPQAEAALMNRIQQLGINYQSDIRPLFGNPATFGALGANVSGGSASALSSSARNAFLFVWVTRDSAKLTALLKKTGLQSAGNHAGATLYRSGSGGTAVAVDGATLIFAPSTSLLNAALDRHSNGGGISKSQADKYMSGLPKDALIQAFGSLNEVLSNPRAAKARNIPWVAAIRGYGTAISATSSGLSFSYRVDTSGRSLSSSQLPLASGGTSPSYAGSGPVQAAMNNPSQLVNFIEGAAQAVNPSGYARFQSRVAAFRAKSGVDFNSTLKQLTGGLALSTDTRATVARVGLSNPATVSNALSKLAGPGGALGSGSGLAPVGGGFYATRQRRSLTVGVVGNQLVVGRAPVPVLRSFASAPSSPASGAHGSVAFRVSIAQLLRARLRRTPPAIVQTILGSLGDYTGWVAATPSALTGNATLALK